VTLSLEAATEPNSKTDRVALGGRGTSTAPFMPGASARGFVVSAALDLEIEEDGFGWELSWGLFSFRHHSKPMLCFWLRLSSFPLLLSYVMPSLALATLLGIAPFHYVTHTSPFTSLKLLNCPFINILLSNLKNINYFWVK